MAKKGELVAPRDEFATCEWFKGQKNGCGTVQRAKKGRIRREKRVQNQLVCNMSQKYCKKGGKKL